MNSNRISFMSDKDALSNYTQGIDRSNPYEVFAEKLIEQIDKDMKDYLPLTLEARKRYGDGALVFSIKSDCALVQWATWDTLEKYFGEYDVGRQHEFPYIKVVWHVISMPGVFITQSYSLSSDAATLIYYYMGYSDKLKPLSLWNPDC